MRDTSTEGDFCEQAEALRHELAIAVGLAERLVSLLLDGSAGHVRPQLEVVGRPSAPAQAVRLAEVIDLGAWRSRPGTPARVRRAAWT